MRAKKGFNLRKVVGEYIVVAEGKENIDFSNIISMNETSAYLWKEIAGKEFTVRDLADLLTQRYEVDDETAVRDSQSIAEKWIEAGIAEA